MLHDPPCKAIDHVCQLTIVDGAETSVVGSLGDGPKTVSLARPFPGTTINKMCWQVRLPICQTCPRENSEGWEMNNVLTWSGALCFADGH